MWTDRQLTVPRPPNNRAVERYFKTFKPDVVLFLETPFAMSVYQYAREYNCVTVGIPMHETFAARRLAADWLFCPNKTAYRKAQGNKKLIFLPIGVKMFPFKERTGHTFVTNIGFGGVHDRRQSSVIARAFSQLRNPDARLIMRAQRQWPDGAIVKDTRITYDLNDYPHPRDIYREGDISILPMAYEGYGRTILESMASGMPTLTTNADPMNSYQHDRDFLIRYHSSYMCTDKWVKATKYHQVGLEDMKKKLEWLLTIDTRKYSHRARRQAVAQSWESTEIDYKGTWLRELEAVCALRRDNNVR